MLVLDWWDWYYFHANFRTFWKNDPCLYCFLHLVRGHYYTRKLILGLISAACPQPYMYLCSKHHPRLYSREYQYREKYKMNILHEYVFDIEIFNKKHLTYRDFTGWYYTDCNFWVSATYRKILYIKSSARDAQSWVTEIQRTLLHFKIPHVPWHVHT